MTALSLTASRIEQPSRSRAWLSWMPLVALVVVAGLAAAGMDPASRATGDATGTVTVQGTISAELHITSLCGQAVSTYTLGPVALTPGVASPEPIGSCSITFGTNNSATGASLRIASQNLDTPFFCAKPSGVRSCATASYADMPVGGTATPDAGTAGFKFTSATSPATAGSTMTVNNFYGIQSGSATELCKTASTSDGTCAITFAARTASGQPSGSYEGVAQINMVAL